MGLQPGSGSGDEWGSLHRLGLRIEWMNEALGASNLERRLCVYKHGAKSAQGYYGYNGMLTSLSHQLCDREWERIDPMSMPLLINRAGRIALAVISGDHMTGQRIPGQGPKSRNPKGELTKELIRINSFHEPEDQPVLFATPKRERQTHALIKELQDFHFWHVLMYYDKQRKEIRSEVSQPSSSNAKGFVDEWTARIILPPYKLDADDFDENEDSNDDFGDDDPTVIRR